MCAVPKDCSGRPARRPSKLRSQFTFAYSLDDVRWRINILICFDFKVQCFDKSISVSTCAPEDIACLCLDTQFLETAAACELLSCTTKETLCKCFIPADCRYIIHEEGVPSI